MGDRAATFRAMRSRWWARLSCVGSVVFVVMAAACGGAETDGAPCDDDSGCESEKCVGGACQGRQCTCQGADCRSRSDCLEGWLCTRGASVSDASLFPRCRKQCSGPGQCVSSEHCDDGICTDGPEPFSMVWESFPRKVGCSPNFPCEYKVRVTSPVTVESFRWTFGGAAPVETTVPQTTFEYTEYGTYAVTVVARASTGATAELKETETLCLLQGASCDPAGVKCCFGACPISGVCP